MSRFNSVILDVDSTLSGIEGIDWLAKLRGKEVEEWSAALTDRAMRGEIPIEAVYSERMGMVKPSRTEIQQLGKEYVDRIAPFARETLAEFKAANIQIVMVSGGLREAILPLATDLGVDEKNLHAVSVFFDAKGGYAGFDGASPLTTQTGKKGTVSKLGLKGPVLAVGDGMTDCEMKSEVDSFAAFTGFTRRERVIQQADFIIEDFDQLRRLVLQ